MRQKKTFLEEFDIAMKKYPSTPPYQIIKNAYEFGLPTMKFSVASADQLAAALHFYTTRKD